MDKMCASHTFAREADSVAITSSPRAAIPRKSGITA